MRILSAFASVFLMALTATAANAERRVAFVVGNGAYKNVAPLPNPPVDAKAMAGVLRNVGFEVVEGTNLTRDKMTEKLLEFGKQAQGADVARVLLCRPRHRHQRHQLSAAGRRRHQIRDGRQARAPPSTSTSRSTRPWATPRSSWCSSTPAATIPFAAKIKSNSATRSVNVQTGLAEMKSGEGTLIAFATGPGQTALDGQEGANSPFTRALIANIAQPGIEIQQAMTKVRAQVNEETNKGQLPWGHTNLIGSVYLNGAAAPARQRGASLRRHRRRLPPRRTRTSSSSSGARSRTPTSRKSSTPI